MQVKCPKCGYEHREWAGWEKSAAQTVTTLLRAQYVGPVTLHLARGEVHSKIGAIETREVAKGPEAPTKALEWANSNDTRSQVTICRDESRTITSAERRIVYSV